MNSKNLIRHILSLFNKILPKKSNEISLYGRSMLNDNTEALLDYLIKEGFNKKYNINLLINSNVIHSKYDNLENIRIIYNPLPTIWRLLRSKYIFHSQGLTLCSMKPAKDQIIFDLWHGSPLKIIGVPAGNTWHSETDSYFLCASPFMSQINKRCFLLNNDQIFIGSNPRNDKLFEAPSSQFADSLKKGRKMIMFMPTYRNSKELNNHDAESDLPILNEENIEDFDNFLRGSNIVFVIKPHPYQNDIPIFNQKYENIVVIKNADLQNIKESLYTLLGQAEALISDFSSVYFDYLILNRPIGFAIDDLNDYKTNRGFTVDDPLDLMPGKKLFNINDLKEFVAEIQSGKDEYAAERERVNTLCNTFTTPDASERILDFVGISK